MVSRQESQEFEDPINCAGCKADADIHFWGKRRFDNRRLEKYLDKIEETPFMDCEEGDKDEEYRLPVVICPFTRGGTTSGKEKWTDFLSSGDGIQHTCVLGRVLANIEVPAFLESRTLWVEKGEGGYGVVVKVSLFGMVDQMSDGTWIWNTAERFFLPFPESVQSIFGKGLVVDGYFELSGQRASRRKKRFLLFRERVADRILSKIHKDVSLKVVWEENFIPGPCSGVTLWAAFATVVEWCTHSGRSRQRKGNEVLGAA